MSAFDHDRYLELFRVEAREHLAELDASLLAFEHDADAAHIAAIFRNTHTIKGMASAMGFQAVERLAHALESLLERVRAGSTIPHAEFVALLFESTDVLHHVVDDAIAGNGADHARPLAEHLTIVQRLESLTDERQHSDLAVPPSERLASAGETLVEVRLRDDCPLKGVRAMLVMARMEPLGTVAFVHPAPSTWHHDAFAGVVVLGLSTTSCHDDIEQAIRAAGDVQSVTFPQESPTTMVSGTTPSARPRSNSAHTVRVDRRRLDTLLELVGELVVTRDRFTTLAEEQDRSTNRELSRAAQQTARLITALQDEILQTRMVHVGQVFDRFPRLVRDIAHGLSKDVELVIEGRDIELDRALVDAIGDPLMHLVRNALDHGIESAAQRMAVGKLPTGRLVVRAARDRAAVIIQVEDDGRGIDRTAILRRAQTQGLIDEALEAIDDDQLLQVLAHPGFSTASRVTAISGRGVGVDVVATRVRALGGVLLLESIAGVGSVFTLRLPVTLAIARALLVQVGTETYALPAAHVVEALAYEPGMASGIVGHEVLTLRDEQMPLIHLRERFGQPRHTTDCYVTVVEVAGRRSALLVDSLSAQKDIVVKPFDVVRGSAPWFTGATVLGDGTPALIVDLGSLT